MKYYGRSIMHRPPSDRLRCCSAEPTFCCIFHHDGRTIAGAGAGYSCVLTSPWVIHACDMVVMATRSNEGERFFVLCRVSGTLHGGPINSSHSCGATSI